MIVINDPDLKRPRSLEISLDQYKSLSRELVAHPGGRTRSHVELERSGSNQDSSHWWIDAKNMFPFPVPPLMLPPGLASPGAEAVTPAPAELEVRSSSDDALAAAVLCQAAGATVLPYPLVEELLAIDGARLALVDPGAPRIDHGDLPGDWVAADLATESIFGTGPMDGAVRVHRGGGRFDEWAGDEPAVNPTLSAAYDLETYISVSFRVAELHGRLFLVDPPRLSLDQVAIAEIVADRLRTLFEHSMLTRRLSQTAAMEERVKIGRELHDG